MIDFRNMDCMELMKEFEDNHFDLAIVDPPYGIGESGKKRGMGTSCMAGEYTVKDWDKEAPKKEYFEELCRVSKNQIIWGANYYPHLLKPSMGWIFWDKVASGDFSDGELAYTSFNKALKKFEFAWMGMRQGDMSKKEIRIHPTQKPVRLYTWLLQNYAKDGDKILDTMVGSASSLIACHQLGFDVVGCELDEEYYNLAQQRIKEETAQLSFL